MALVPLKKPNVPSFKLIMGGMAGDSAHKCFGIESYNICVSLPKIGLIRPGRSANITGLSNPGVIFAIILMTASSVSAPRNGMGNFILEERS